MTPLSRREFGKVIAAGVPLSAAIASITLAAAFDTVCGVSTSSFRELPRVTGRDNVDDVIRALQSVRATHIELALANVEPAPPGAAPVMGGSNAYPRRIVLSPEEVAATNAGARAALRTWRLGTDAAFFDGVRATFAAAGITVHACALSYNDSFTDAEIDATFRQVKALGVTTVSSPMTLATAKRLAAFAERHRVSVAIHNQTDGNAAGAIATPQLRDALALSPAFLLKLDIGNLTASNCDAVAMLHDYQSRAALVSVKDRLRNGGVSQPFGEGDTPIAGVLEALKAAASTIPVLVEYDYVGLRPVVDEVATSMAYVRRVSK
jgi:sugar phosphate isomerase/epimerase